MPIYSVTFPLKRTYVHLTLWVPILFYSFHLKSQFNPIFIVNLTLSTIFVYSLSLFLCLHVAIKSHLWFYHFSGSGYCIICIFSSRHWLHLLSKHFGIFNFFNMLHWISFFSNSKIAWIGSFGSSNSHGRKNDYDYWTLASNSSKRYLYKSLYP